MKTTTIKLSGGILGSETMLVRCQLANAAAGVEVDYCMGEGWGPTQYQAGDARHTSKGLADIGIELAQVAVQEQGTCDWEEVVTSFEVRMSDAVENTGLDNRYFATREEAQAAADQVNSDSPRAHAEVCESRQAVSITLAEWMAS